MNKYNCLEMYIKKYLLVRGRQVSIIPKFYFGNAYRNAYLCIS